MQKHLKWDLCSTQGTFLYFSTPPREFLTCLYEFMDRMGRDFKTFQPIFFGTVARSKIAET